MIHSDERRTLEDWPEAKIITGKKDNCIIGNHYHKIKTELFVLTSGFAGIKVNRNGISKKGGKWELMKKGQMYTVAPTMYHAFRIHRGTTIIGLCSHPFDPTDDYK